MLTSKKNTVGAQEINWGGQCPPAGDAPVSKEARLLGVTLDSKLTWKPHITRITRKAATALMQCRQTVGKTWE